MYVPHVFIYRMYVCMYRMYVCMYVCVSVYIYVIVYVRTPLCSSSQLYRWFYFALQKDMSVHHVDYSRRSALNFSWDAIARFGGARVAFS